MGLNQTEVAPWRLRLGRVAVRLNWIGAIGVVGLIISDAWIREATCESALAGKSSTVLEFLQRGLPSVSFLLLLAAFVMALVGWRPRPLAAGVVLLFTAMSFTLFGNPVRCRYVTNESSAVNQLRTINTAEQTYRKSAVKYGTIPDLVSANLIDARFRDEQPVSGYSYSVIVTPDGQNYMATAVSKARQTGRFNYVSQQDGIVRYSDEPAFAPAGLTGKPVE